jgi:UDP-N-acetylmuramate dehydrogenase
MNAGGHGSDMAGCLDRWAFVDLNGGPDGERTLADLRYGYRRSSVAEGHVVLWASFPLRDGNRERSEETIAEIVRWRRANQPGGQNAGSVFTNPEGDSAGRIIEACGLKGRRLGTAQVSAKHANFIQADAGGSADDVRRLIEVVRERVRDEMGIELLPEVRMVGFA